jgi:predicted MFS family arabinose efflux permease
LLTSMVVYAFVGIAPAFLTDLYAIIAARVAVGICESIVITVSTTMIGDYFTGRTRERWMASQTAVASLSALGIIYLGGQLGAAYGWRGPFYLYMYSLVLAIGVYAFVWEPAIDRPPSTDLTSPTRPRFPWARMLGICGLTLLASTSFYTVVTKNAEAMVALGVSDPAIIAKYTMLASIGVPLGTFIYWGLSRLPIHWLLLIDFALLGTGFIWMGRAADPTTYAWGSFINQVGCGIVLPTMLVWATRGLTYAIRGRGIGMWQAAFAIGQFLSGMAVTLLSKQLGGLLPALQMMGEAAIAFAACAWFVGCLWRPSRPARIESIG